MQKYNFLVLLCDVSGLEFIRLSILTALFLKIIFLYQFKIKIYLCNIIYQIG